MRCVSFEGFLPKGATRPFIARTKQGRHYVVKAHRDPPGTKILFNEYIAGLLAKEMGLSWPNVHIVQLSHYIIERLIQKDFEVLSGWAVGIEYIDGLEEVRWPENAPDYSSPNFAERNVQYIKKIFPDPITYDAFYGKAVFDNWILLEDTTYDTLHKSQEGHPIFLDASHALGGYKKWNENKLNWNRIDPERSIYLVGFNFDLKKFEPWLNRIDRIDNDSIKEKIAEIPEEWGVPDIYFKSINEFLTSTRNRFLPMFKEWIVFSEGNFFDVT